MIADQLIGRLIRNSSTTEMFVFVLICGLSGVRIDIGALIIHEGFEYRARNLVRLARVVGVEEVLLSELDSWSRRAVTMYAKRNYVAHATWTQGDADEVGGAFSMKKLLKSPSDEILGQAELEQLCEEADSVVAEGNALFFRFIREVPGAWPSRI